MAITLDATTYDHRRHGGRVTYPPDVQRLVVQVWSDYHDFAVPNRVILVRARDDDTTVAYACCETPPGGEAYLVELVVDAARRGQGIGEQLLRDVAERALDAGAATIATRLVRDGNLARRTEWFVSFGFTHRRGRDVWAADTRRVTEGRPADNLSHRSAVTPRTQRGGRRRRNRCGGPVAHGT